MLEGFIKHHGTSSNKCRELILVEVDIADRIYNIHTITGNNKSPILLKTLKRTFSQEFEISSINSSTDLPLTDSVQLLQDFVSIIN